MKILIIAGGLATRMGSLAENIPKCLIDINGTPLIEHQLKFFKKNGYKDIIFCVAHLAGKVRKYFGDGGRLGMNISYTEETENLMGTAGSAYLARSKIDDDFIVYYGDNLTSMNIEKFVSFHREKNGIATICIRPLPEGYKSSSIISLDSESKVKAFIEKPGQDTIDKFSKDKLYINSGIYAFNIKIFEYIPKGKKFDFAHDLFPLLIKDKQMYGYPTEEFFFEVGRPEKYEKLLRELKGKKEFL